MCMVGGMITELEHDKKIRKQRRKFSKQKKAILVLVEHLHEIDYDYQTPAEIKSDVYNIVEQLGNLL